MASGSDISENGRGEVELGYRKWTVDIAGSELEADFISLMGNVYRDYKSI